MKRFLAHLILLALFATTANAAEPLKVYILAGQSNMEGHARTTVVDYMGEDPVSAPLLKKIKKPDGSFRMIDDVWISYQTGNQGRIDRENREVYGQLTAGYGSQGRRDYSKPGEKIGPELAFGITMQEGLEQPVLIIKTAWGGQSLHTDYRSPSSGPYVPTEDDIKRKRFDTPEKQQALKKKTGARYHQMVEHVRFVLKDIKRVYPGYDPANGYELSGFVWFQGFNDLVGRNVYPEIKNSTKPRYTNYTKWMANFIRDVRKDLKAPEMPFVIGVLGVGGKDTKPHVLDFRSCQAAPADLPEFKGNVFAVPTAPYWDERLAVIDDKRQQLRQKRYFLDRKHSKHENADGKLTKQEINEVLKKFESELFTQEDLDLEKRAKSNAGYHYLGSAKTYSLIGEAFAKALLKQN